MNSFFLILRALLEGIGTGIVVSVPLGPAGIESVKRTLSDGFKKGFTVSVGALSADILYIFLINAGLSGLFPTNTRLQYLFWIISGIILAIIGYYSMMKAKGQCPSYGPNSVRELLANDTIGYVNFLSGFLITFSNPLTPAVWITLSGTAMKIWMSRSIVCYYVYLFSIIFTMFSWFATLNYLAMHGNNLLSRFTTAKNKSNITSRILAYVILGIGIGFIVYGLIHLIIG